MEPIINESDRKAVDKLRLLVSDTITSDFTDFDLLRWLQGHDYNYDHIVPNLKHHFRVLRSYDFLKLKPDPVMDHYWPQGMLGLTGKDDNFIYMDCMGTLDGEGIIKSTSLIGMMLYRFCYVETKVMPEVRKREKETGRQSGVILIQDLDKAPLNTTSVALLTGAYRLYLQTLLIHYAEVFQKGILVNSPSFVQILWRLIKPFLPEKTKKKVIILGSDWKKEILEYVDADALPVHWGGNMVDENDDPKCQTRVVVPSVIPIHLHWFKSKNDPAMDELTSLVVPAGRVNTVTVRVDNEGDVLWWYFFAQTYFGFGVFYTENDEETDVEKMEMVYPQIRQVYAPSFHPETDEIRCKKIGFYILWFGNESSWITKLRLNYKVALKSKS